MKTGFVITHLNSEYVSDSRAKFEAEKLAGLFDVIELSERLNVNVVIDRFNDLFFDEAGVHYSDKLINVLAKASVLNGYVNHNGLLFFSASGELNNDALSTARAFDRLVLAGAYVNQCHDVTFIQSINHLPGIQEYIMIGDTMFCTKSLSVSKLCKNDWLDLFKWSYINSKLYLRNKPLLVDFNLLESYVFSPECILTKYGEFIRDWSKFSLDYLMKNSLLPRVSDVKVCKSVSVNDCVNIKYFSTTSKALEYLS